ncbi:hypothetical protein BGZ61DRAFT_229402 [Ilyonectria robusta]|uniref:uncharacterized protein n=1 Tax=Ilyonectria robusta TaxID=1079257 RepID=UPI001E8E9914|nr:uncharacterized protein BGZ61DRAFT_229402 [Ilyonectria robusta]KAH8651749.1 hypothetical protein BGZ61DRAFT_229402 [Ilyonectria robusta]
MPPRADLPAAALQLPQDVPLTFVFSAVQGDVHVFLPESFDIRVVYRVAMTLSRRVNQPVTTFLDHHRQKYRLCPLSYHVLMGTSYGLFCFTCDETVQARATRVNNAEGAAGPPRIPIPHPDYEWMLYRQAKSQEVTQKNPGIPASRISNIIAKMWRDETPEVKTYWRALVQDGNRKHKQQQNQGYKFTARKNTN